MWRFTIARPMMSARAALDKAFHALAGVARGEPVSLPLLGREIAIPQASSHVARFDYADLCKRPLGAADFLAIAENFHVLVVDNIPAIKPEERNEAKRFINLIDALYDQKVKLIASARRRAGQALSRRTGPRGLRIRAHGLAPDGNALDGIYGPAPRSRRCGER